MFDKQAPLIVTEWMWLKMSLRVYSFSTRSQLYSVYFDFREEERPEIVCRIFGDQVQKMVEGNEPQPAQQEYYIDWVNKEKRAIRGIVQELPVLAKAFDPESDVVFKIMYHYGMGASVVCQVSGLSCSWPGTGK
jgi:hypothetical protein